MENQKYKHQDQGKLKGKGLTIAIISFSVLIIVLFPLTAWLTGKIMLKIASTRKMPQTEELSGISIGLEIYGNGSTQSPTHDIRMKCNTNMSALAKAIQMYFNEFGQYPTGEKWCDLLIEKYKIDIKTFRCPGAKEGPCNYALNINTAQPGTIAPGDTVLLFESQPGWNQVGGPELLTTENHPGTFLNISFVDSHVEFIQTQNFDKLKWKPEDKK